MNEAGLASKYLVLPGIMLQTVICSLSGLSLSHHGRMTPWRLSSALGEEIGWRGFLVPELAKRMSFARVSLLSGIIWTSWHSPILLFADYNAGTNRWYALGCFAVTVTAASFLYAWLTLKSGSLWPAALLHASHNLFV